MRATVLCLMAAALCALPAHAFFYGPQTGKCASHGLDRYDGNWGAVFNASWGGLGNYDGCTRAHGKWCRGFIAYNCVKPGGNKSIERFGSRCQSFQVPTIGVCLPRECDAGEWIGTTAQMAAPSSPHAATWAQAFQDLYGTFGIVCNSDILDPLECDWSLSSAYPFIMCDGPNPYRRDGNWVDEPPRLRTLIIISIAVGLSVLVTFVHGAYASVTGLYRIFKGEEVPYYDSAAYEESLADLATPLGGGMGAPEENRAKGIADAALRICNFFNLWKNWLEFIEVKERHNALTDTRFMEGLRVIAMLFVVYGHTLFFPNSTFGFENETEAYAWITTYHAVGLFPAELAVDVFFYLSGFLFYYLYHNNVDKRFSKEIKDYEVRQANHITGETATLNSGYYSTDEPPPKRRPISILELLLMYLHRWLRIVPVVAVMIFGTTYLIDLLPEGPLAATLGPSLTYGCKSGWWHTLLFVQNFHDKWLSCMGWFWYLSCDFQLFVFAPIVSASRFIYLPRLLPARAWRETFTPGHVNENKFLSRTGRYFGGFVFHTIVVGAIVGGTVGAVYKLPFDNGENLSYFHTQVRMAPYFWGMLIASIIRNETVREWIKSPRLRLALYVCGTGLCVACVNLMWKLEEVKIRETFRKVEDPLNPGEPDKMLHRFVNGFVMAAWGLGLGCFTMCWGCGHGGPVAHFLGHPIFAVVSKLTYCCYMIHPIVIGVFYASGRHQPVFTEIGFYTMFGAFAVWTFTGATGLHLLIEVPAAKLNTLLTRSHRKK